MDYHGHGYSGRDAAWKPSTGDLTMPITKPLPKELLQTSTTLTSAELLDEMARDSGLGVSTDAADLLIPRLRVIQKTSSATDPQRPEYVRDARAGDFLLGLTELRSGKDGIEVIPAGMKLYFIETTPDRTFVARHDVLPTDAARDRDSNRPIWRRANGNLVEDVREFALVCNGESYLLSCRGTGHVFARRWQTLLRAQRHPVTGKVLASFGCKYRLTTGPEHNSQGNWYGLRVELIGRVTDAAEYTTAKTLHSIVTGGSYAAEDPNESAAGYSQDHQSPPNDDPFNGL
jgi:hypothetical protein